MAGEGSTCFVCFFGGAFFLPGFATGYSDVSCILIMSIICASTSTGAVPALAAERLGTPLGGIICFEIAW